MNILDRSNCRENSRFIIVRSEKDRDFLLSNGFKLVNTFDNGKEKNYAFMNRPSLIKTFKSADIDMFFTNRLMF